MKCRWKGTVTAGILGIVMFLTCLTSAYAKTPSGTEDISKTSEPLAGICLDCSNRYYSVSQIERYIRLAAESENGYLQLHLTGDRNIGIECRLLGQKPDRKYRHGKSEYYNPKTKKPFLTYGQIHQILKYADERGVQVVPEIDMPGHMKGFAGLYRKKYGRKAASRIFGSGQDALQIRSREAQQFAQKIYHEYAQLFSGCRYFHIGCDEFWDGREDWNISYINQMASYMQKKGFCVWIWNDLLTRKNMKQLDRNITITYWSWDGDSESASVRSRRQKVRASLPELQNAGFHLLNYNSYYLYYVPSASDTDEDDRYMVQDLKDNWNLRKWNGEKEDLASSEEGLDGAAVSVWNEDSEGVSFRRIWQNTKRLYRTMAGRIRHEV